MTLVHGYNIKPVNLTLCVRCISVGMNLYTGHFHIFILAADLLTAKNLLTPFFVIFIFCLN